MSSLSFKTTDAYDGVIVFNAPKVSGNYTDLVLPLVTSDTAGNLLPGKSSVTLGTSANKWSKAFIGTLTANTTASTSDERLKTNISPVSPEARAKAKRALQSVELKTYAFKSDPKTPHLGMIAQDVEKAFSCEGLDAQAMGVVFEDGSGYLHLDYTAILLLLAV